MADRLWGALRAHPAATPAELATAAARLLRAAVTALLTIWQAEGSVTSAAGATARAARRWAAVHTALPAAPLLPEDSAPGTDPDPSQSAHPDSVAGAPAAGERDTAERAVEKAGAAPVGADATPKATPFGGPTGAGRRPELARGTRPDVESRPGIHRARPAFSAEPCAGWSKTT